MFKIWQRIALVVIISTMGLSAQSASWDDPNGGWLFLGLGGGILDQSENDFEMSEGTQWTLKGGYSYYAKRIVWDFDLGAHLSETDGDDIYSPLAELGARWRFGKRWHGGLNILGLFDEARGLASSATSASNTDFVPFAGLALFRDFPLGGRNMWRLGAKVMTDLTIDDTTAMMYLLEVHFGFPVSPTKIATAAVVAPVVAATVPVVKAPPVVKEISLADANKVFRFELGASKLNSSDEAYLRSSVSALKTIQDSFETIELTGHADNTGKAKFNDYLSNKRAEFVKKILVEEGIDASKISTMGLSSSQPVFKADGTYDMKGSRRVEMNIKGIRDLGKIKSILGL